MAVGEWDQRQLCPDGGCVGVIGPDGTCKVCGRAAPNWGDERKRGLIDPPDEDADQGDADDLDDDELAADGGDGDGDGDEYDDDDADDDDGHDDGDRAGAGMTGPSGEWGDRRLCADGSCIGVVGADGRCKVCGRTPAQVHAGAPSSAAAPAAPPDAVAGTTDDKAPERSDGEAPP